MAMRAICRAIPCRRSFSHLSPRRFPQEQQQQQHPSPSPSQPPPPPDGTRLKETIFSGIQPTGIPHLGNYLGALRQWKDLQDEEFRSKDRPLDRHRLFLSIVDLHSLTGQQSGKDRSRLRIDSFASLLAMGLDPDLSTIFLQSHMPQHAELMWILSTVASTGYLSRMTQWKSKLDLPESISLSDAKATETLKLGLFSYPVLQAADILLYRATLVPVGEDQRQHVEFTRNLARSFNAHYSKRIMSLRDPMKKMSKSHQDPRSMILITDTPEDIHSKIKSALTDSDDGITYEPERRPGVANLIEILKHVSRNPASCEEIAIDLSGSGSDIGIRAFKEKVADEVVRALNGIRERFLDLTSPTPTGDASSSLESMNGNTVLRDAMVQGVRKARAEAGQTMRKVRETLGIEDLGATVLQLGGGRERRRVKWHEHWHGAKRHRFGSDDVAVGEEEL